MKKTKLDQIEKKIPFEAPDGYFDDLAMRVQKRVEREDKSFLPQWLNAPVWRLSAASALMGIIAIAFYFNPTDSPELMAQEETSSYQEIVAEISAEDLTSYLAEDADWHNAELYEIAELTENTTSESQEALEEEVLNSMDLQELEDYL